jgi:hypothetical protein
MMFSDISLLSLALRANQSAEVRWFRGFPYFELRLGCSRRFDMTVAWALAAFGFLFGLGAQEVRRFENLAAQDIRSTLQGEEAKVRVRTELHGIIGGPLGDLRRVDIEASHFSTPGLPLFTEPQFSQRGIVRELNIRLYDFVLAGLRVESLEASIPDCRFDYGLALREKKIRLSRSGVGVGTVRVRQEDLERYILEKFQEIKRVSVRIDKDKVFVEGHGEFVLIQTDFWVVASLVPHEGNQLMLTDARIFFGDRRADEASAQVLLDTLNPVVHLDRDLNLHGAIRLRGLRLRDGVLEAWGATRIPERPQHLLDTTHRKD